MAGIDLSDNMQATNPKLTVDQDCAADPGSSCATRAGLHPMVRMYGADLTVHVKYSNQAYHDIPGWEGIIAYVTVK